jgi:glycosyl transferase family 2
MRVVLTLLVRDEVDIVEANLRHHLALGVDHVVVTDHRSADGTTDVLRSFEREGRLTLFREESEELRQSDWVTRMARLAATELGADWVINGDADEFWWPRDGTLHDVLMAVPARYGAVRGMWRNFVPRPEDGRPFHERMTIRRRPATELTDPFHAQVKVAHRGHPDVVVSQGNHDALRAPLALIREWLPFELLHFPLRSAEQAGRKFRVARTAGLASPGTSVPQHTDAAVRSMDAEGDSAFYQRLVADDAAVEAGLESGELVVDTRVRDIVRGNLAGGPQPPPAPPTLADDAAFAVEAQAMLEHDAWVKLSARADHLERRLGAVDRSPFAGRNTR